MAGQPDIIAKVRQGALQRIREARLAGKDTRHSRATNLHAIAELVKGHPHYTFGIKGVERFSEEEVLEAIADITKCSKDLNMTEGGGYISPEATLKGLEIGARTIVSTARQGGRFVVATGHPGALLLYYIELARLIHKWGGEVIQVERGVFVPPHFDLDYVEEVAVLSDRCSIWHSHDPAPMEIILKAAGHVDLVVADHGFAGGAINAGVPVVGIVDTNDPALAVAKRMGADVVIIPMDDNRPLSAYLDAVEIVRQFAELEITPLAADGGGVTGATSGWPEERERVKIRREITEAEKLVQERLGPQEVLDEAIESFVEAFKDQFMQAHFNIDNDAIVNDPHVTLAIYSQLQAAIQRFIANEIGELQLDLTQDEIDFYLGRRRDK